eukprot:6091604-Alexandrium_andersonii.AAC.1
MHAQLTTTAHGTSEQTMHNKCDPSDEFHAIDNTSRDRANRQRGEVVRPPAVSYTHLTLPTICSV